MNGMSLPALGGAAVSAGLRGGIEHAVAVGYGLTYDAIVSSFAPYQALLEEITGYAKRSVGPRRDPRSVHVLDVASGIGTLAFRLAREGYALPYTFPPNVAHSAELVAAAAEARDTGRGLWSACR